MERHEVSLTAEFLLEHLLPCKAERQFSVLHVQPIPVPQASPRKAQREMRIARAEGRQVVRPKGDPQESFRHKTFDHRCEACLLRSE